MSRSRVAFLLQNLCPKPLIVDRTEIMYLYTSIPVAGLSDLQINHNTAYYFIISFLILNI
jgi:hypothetical protein